MRAVWAMALAACVTSNSQRVEPNPTPGTILCDGDLECPAGMRSDAGVAKRALPPGTILCSGESPCPTGMSCVWNTGFAHAGDPLEDVEHCERTPTWTTNDLLLSNSRDAGLPKGTILCGSRTPCPRGMSCVVFETFAPTGDPLDGVEHCERTEERKTANDLRRGPWDAGILRWLDEPLDAGSR